MKEIEKNKIAWNQLSKDHYEHFKKELSSRETLLNKNILRELGDVQGRSLIHLQCNTGADTISLARLGLSKVVGVDLSNENIKYANLLKHDFKMDMVSFIESDVLSLEKIHKDKYDIVFTSEGVLGWLPDLDQWARVVRSLLKDDGYFYIYDSHPFFHTFDEEKLAKQELILKYDYFNAKADMAYEIGGYASQTMYSENYWWNHTLSDIINALIKAGLKIEYLHEYDTLFWNNGRMEAIDKGLYIYPKFRNKLPMSFSIKASVL
ncbi:class I SAM-dependent methyltransferase [Hujiaoplasma nucleasis]|uniref:Class I SAM-dependent methyltransferase n=1 Tax=Hujiaoplasma nucleasis TaxID=2725268 RepID=A0A7L6N132_9MOLU|nr:class I SAM-dependent methyltransferase [Hujiaoplasma nucleasis]QLY39873.1 class I SAM-dependent methyltransferase [Hujiaoplasma nucleasis]